MGCGGNAGCIYVFLQGILLGFNNAGGNGCCVLAGMPQAQGRFAKTMDKDQTVKYPGEVLKPVKRHLAEKLTDLEKRKRQMVAEDPFTDTSRTVDNAAIDTDAAEQAGHMRVSALKLTYERSIIQVRKALARIKIGKYGVCERCGKMIDTDRLMIMPETTLCVDCEMKREK